jgi:hypothetical protein
MVGVTLLADGEPRMAGFTEDSSNIFGWDRRETFQIPWPGSMIPARP